ncbi:MAG: hypothetical protein R2813_08845 [Flavobacteriales bacterium]
MILIVFYQRCSKDLFQQNGDVRSQPQRSSSDFDPLLLSDSAISALVYAFKDDYQNRILGDMTPVEAMWSMEAYLNNFYCHTENSAVLYSDSVIVTTPNDSLYSGDLIESTLDSLVTHLNTVISNLTLDTGVAQIGIADLELKSEGIYMLYYVTRGLAEFNLSYRSYLLCNKDEVYPWSSTLVTNGLGYQVWLNDFYCSGANSSLGHGVNRVMKERLSAKLRGFSCSDLTTPVTCLLHSVGSYSNNGNAAWSTGCYSSTYPHLMPHAGVYNWSITGTCHNGDAIRCVTDNRIYPWIINYTSSNYSGFVPLFVDVWRPVLTSSNGNGGYQTMNIRVTYGRCATYSGDH